MSTFLVLFRDKIEAQNASKSHYHSKIQSIDSNDLSFQSYFTAYLNMARQNCCIVLSHISKSLGFKTGDIIDTTLSKAPILGDKGLLSNKKEISELIKVKLLSAFPVLDPMIRYSKKRKEEYDSDYDKVIIDAKDVAGMLVMLLDVLTYYRDMASHVVFNDSRISDNNFKDVERKVANSLNYAMTVALREVKSRFTLDETDLKFYNKNRYEMVKETVEVNGSKETIFKPSLDKSKPHSICSTDGCLSLIGVVFLISQLVEKQYATMFFDALGKRFYAVCDAIPQINIGTKKNRQMKNMYEEEAADKQREKQRSILREAFSILRVRLPRERLESTRCDIALGLDILNELGKCPQELFDLLSIENQNIFRIKSETGEDVLMRRYGDRFPQLALRWLDETEKFNKLRFHVTYGKYRWLFCPEKKCVDGEVRPRWLQKELNGFGRIQKVEKLRTGVDSGWDGVELIRKFDDVVSDDEQKDAYITDFRTQYLFNRDKIGISMADSIPGIHEKNRVPDAWLSVYDIPAVLFMTILKGNGVDVETIINNCLGVYKKLYEDFKNKNWDNINKDKISSYSIGRGTVNYTLQWKDVPRRIRDQVGSVRRNSFEVKAKAILEQMAMRTERQLDRFRKQLETAKDLDNNKQGKDLFVDIRAGKLASFLAKDIVRLMPVADGGKNKPTGLNYCIIQKEIATYGSKDSSFERLNNVFDKAGVFTHPFLKTLLDEVRPLTVLKFYESYLEKRIAYLKCCLAKPADYRTLSFLKGGSLKYAVDDTAYVARLSEAYAKTPLFLPSGLFINALKHILYKEDGKNMDRNVSSMISEYFKNQKNDANQVYYEFPRNYKLFDVLANSKEPVYLSLDERKACKAIGKINDFMSSDALFDFYNKKEEELYDELQRLEDELAACTNNKDKIKISNKINEQSQVCVKFDKEVVAWDSWYDSYDPQKNDKPFDTSSHPEFEYINRILRLRKQVDESERILRRYQVQDMLLFLAAKDMLRLPESDNFKLKNLMLDDNPNNILASTVDEVMMDIAWTEKIIDAENPEKKVRIKKTASIKEKNVVIKNYGRMFKLLYDDRVKSVLPHLCKPAISGEIGNDRITLDGHRFIIDKSLFDEDLANYDIRRHEVCEMILEFERRAFSLCSSLTDVDSKVDFSVILSKMLQEGILTKEKEEVLRAIRNAYNHNKYPDSDLDVISAAAMPKLTDKLYRVLNDYTH